jgi:hypothetical protein
MFNNRRLGHQQKRSLLPRRCYLSNKLLWFKRCEVVHCMITGPGEPMFETYWCDPKEFLLNELKR